MGKVVGKKPQPKKKYKSPGSPHKKETKENIKKALEVGKLKKKFKESGKELKKELKAHYTSSIKETGKRYWEALKAQPKVYKEAGKHLASLSPKDIVEGTKTAARALESMIPGRKEAYLKRNKGGPVDARKIAKKYFKGTF